MEITEKQWSDARIHLNEKIDQYKDLIGKSQVNPIFALSVLHKLGGRLSQGERTTELYEEIMKIN